VNPRRLLVLLCILVAAAAGAWWLQDRLADEDPLRRDLEVPPASERPILSGDPARAARITVERPRYGQRVRVVRDEEDGVWRLEEPIRDWAEPAVMRNVFLALWGEDWREAPPEWEGQSDADLGLAPAALVVEVRYADGDAEVLRIGALDAAGAFHAAERNGERVRVGEGVMSRLNRDLATWRDHRLQPLPAPAVHEVVWEPEDGERMVLRRRGDHWLIVEPFRAPADERQEPRIEQALAARAEVLGAEADPDPETLGPRVAELTVRGSGHEFVLDLHRVQALASHRAYAMEWNPRDFQVFFDGPEALRSPRLLDLDLGTLQSILIERDGVRAVFRRSPNGWRLVGGDELPPEERAYVDALARHARRQEVGETVPRPERPPDGRAWFSISREPRPERDEGIALLEWWREPDGSTVVASGEGGRVTPSEVDFDLGVTDLFRRLGLTAVDGD